MDAAVVLTTKSCAARNFSSFVLFFSAMLAQINKKFPRNGDVR